MDFITLENFVTLAGCVAVVGILTQACKYIPKVKDMSSLWINFILSLIVGIIRVCVVGDFTAGGIVTGILNVLVILVSTSGTYEYTSKSINAIKTKLKK